MTPGLRSGGNAPAAPTHSDAMIYVLETLFQQAPDSGLHCALLDPDWSIDNPRAISILSNDDTNAMQFTNAAGNKQNLAVGQSRRLRVFRDMLAFNKLQGNTIMDVTTITLDEFTAYMMSVDYPIEQSPTYIALQQSSHAPPVGNSTACSITPRDQFMKGIKRDVSLFPTLKNKESWDNWNRSLHAIARTQGVADVLNHNYTPGTQEEKDLFAVQNKFMYSVFERTLLTSQGKTFVRQHENDYDAQTLYTSLLQYLRSSTKGIMKTSSILSYLSSTKLGDDSWKGSIQDFLLHWQDQLRQYDKMVARKDQPSDNVKRIMLENAVHGFPALWQVNTESDQHIARTGTVKKSIKQILVVQLKQ